MCAKMWSNSNNHTGFQPFMKVALKYHFSCALIHLVPPHLHIIIAMTLILATEAMWQVYHHCQFQWTCFFDVFFFVKKRKIKFYLVENCGKNMKNILFENVCVPSITTTTQLSFPLTHSIKSSRFMKGAIANVYYEWNLTKNCFFHAFLREREWMIATSFVYDQFLGCF